MEVKLPCKYVFVESSLFFISIRIAKVMLLTTLLVALFMDTRKKVLGLKDWKVEKSMEKLYKSIEDLTCRK